MSQVMGVHVFLGRHLTEEEMEAFCESKGCDVEWDFEETDGLIYRRISPTGVSAEDLDDMPIIEPEVSITELCVFATCVDLTNRGRNQTHFFAGTFIAPTVPDPEGPYSKEASNAAGEEAESLTWIVEQADTVMRRIHEVTQLLVELGLPNDRVRLHAIIEDSF